MPWRQDRPSPCRHAWCNNNNGNRAINQLTPAHRMYPCRMLCDAMRCRHPCTVFRTLRCYDAIRPIDIIPATEHSPPHTHTRTPTLTVSCHNRRSALIDERRFVCLISSVLAVHVCLCVVRCLCRGEETVVFGGRAVLGVVTEGSLLCLTVCPVARDGRAG